MKLIPVLLLIALCSNAQTKLSGTFLSAPDSMQNNTSSWITFKNDSSFELVYISCMLYKKGKGFYKLQHKNLELHFAGNIMPKDSITRKYPSSHYPIKDGTVYNYKVIKQCTDTLTLQDANYNYTTVYLKLKK
jgi:hypothetical protein